MSKDYCIARGGVLEDLDTLKIKTNFILLSY